MNNQKQSLASKVAITGLVLISLLFILAVFNSSNELHNTVRMAQGLSSQSIIEQFFK